MPWTEQLPSGKYQARYKLPNGQKRSAGVFVHKRRAEIAAIEAEDKAQRPGWRDPRMAHLTWGVWCDQWWPTRTVSPGTLKREASPRDKYLRERWGATPLIDITRHDVKAWIAELLDSGLAPSSVQRYSHIFTASLTAAVDAEILSSHPATRIKFTHGQTDVRRYLSRKQQKKLSRQIPEQYQVLVATLLGTGLRWGEAIGLQVQRTDLKRGYIRVAEVWDARNAQVKKYPKGRKIRDVPIPPWLIPQLKDAIGKRKTGFVFEERINIDNWRKRVWEPAVTRSGIGHTRIHDLRHTYASMLLQSGASLARVGQLLGHASPSTTQIYAHLAETPDDDVVKGIKNPLA